jgi:D-citramalate synthase
MKFNVYLEDWSGGMLESPDHVFGMLEALARMPFKRIMLPDTLGLLDPRQTYEFIRQIVARHPAVRFDYHGHNDYGLATANSVEALRAGARGVHTTINGLGERAGNAPLDEVIVALTDFTPYRSRVDEKKLQEVSRLMEVFSGKRVAGNKPITGEDVFTQTAGIHADGDKKGDLYASRLTPARFNRNRTYALGKLMGRASLEFNLKKLGIELNEEQKKLVLNKVVELADTKKTITGEDLPFIISDVLEAPETRLFEVKDFMIVSHHGLQPVASVLVRYKDREFQASSSGDGGYDAFMKALRRLEGELGFKIPTLQDYRLRIPPGGKTDALVETTILWEGGIKTRAVSSDQLVAAIEATSHAINIIAQRVGEATRKPA